MKYDDQLIEFSQLERRSCPTSSGAVDVVGPLRPEAAAELGLPAGIEVVGGTPDVQSATLGSGAIDDFAAHLYLGTSSWITCHVPFKKTDLFTNIASLPAALPDRYFVGNDQETAGGCLVVAAATTCCGPTTRSAPAPRRPTRSPGSTRWPRPRRPGAAR